MGKSVPLESPRKSGILMTPGTAALRRKTVSFPAGVKGSGGGVQAVVGAEGAHGTLLDEDALFGVAAAPTPKDVPGKFPSPSPWARRTGEGARRRGGSLRAQTSRDAAKAGEEGKEKGTAEDATLDFTAPRSTSGRYWKMEYEAYSANSTVEMRRLAKKEQLAKKFARMKDAETAGLREELRVERKKARGLERRVKEEDGIASELKEEEEEEVCGIVEVETPERLRRRVGKAEREVEELRKEKREADEAMEEMTKQCERLRHEIESLRSASQGLGGDDHTKQQPKAASRPRKAMESFDIWADAAVLDKDEALPSIEDSSPLKTREANEVSQRDIKAASPLKDVTNSNAPEKSKIVDSKEDRLAAAKRRLEERRRNREKGVV